MTNSTASHVTRDIRSASGVLQAADVAAIRNQAQTPARESDRNRQRLDPALPRPSLHSENTVEPIEADRLVHVLSATAAAGPCNLPASDPLSLLAIGLRMR